MPKCSQIFTTKVLATIGNGCSSLEGSTEMDIQNVAIDQRAPSSLSFPIISSTFATFTPACLAGGSATFNVVNLGLRSTPKS